MKLNVVCCFSFKLQLHHADCNKSGTQQDTKLCDTAGIKSFSDAILSISLRVTYRMNLALEV